MSCLGLSTHLSFTLNTRSSPVSPHSLQHTAKNRVYRYKYKNLDYCFMPRLFNCTTVVRIYLPRRGVWTRFTVPDMHSLIWVTLNLISLRENFRKALRKHVRGKCVWVCACVQISWLPLSKLCLETAHHLGYCGRSEMVSASFTEQPTFRIHLPVLGSTVKSYYSWCLHRFWGYDLRGMLA